MGTITAEVVDTGEKRDTRGRRVTPGQRRSELVAAYRRSGMTMAEFARREKVHYSTLAGWIARARRRESTGPITFAQLPWSGSGEAPARDPLEVRFPDGTVLRGAKVADLVALVRALKA